jgi:hypothetical protein
MLKAWERPIRFHQRHPGDHLSLVHPDAVVVANLQPVGAEIIFGRSATFPIARPGAGASAVGRAPLLAASVAPQIDEPHSTAVLVSGRLSYLLKATFPTTLGGIAAVVSVEHVSTTIEPVPVPLRPHLVRRRLAPWRL